MQQRTHARPAPVTPPWKAWLIFAVLLVATGFSASRYFFPHNLTPINVLVLGIDDARSDTMIVAHYDPGQHLVSLLSIPRDSKVVIPGRKGYDKINAAHAYGGDKDGPLLAKQTVQQYLGIQIDYWVRFDFQGFPKLIDALGGVDLTIAHPMDYDDPYQDLHIHFKPGQHHLDGKQALEFVRYRKDSVDPNRVSGSDIDREGRQHEFLRALLTSLHKRGALLRLPAVIPAAYKAVSTDMPTSVATDLAALARSVGPDRLITGTVPGTDSNEPDGWFWISTPAEVRDAVDRYLRHPQPPAQAVGPVAA